jgi:hypothetical protein
MKRPASDWLVCTKCGARKGWAAHPELLCPVDDKTPHDWQKEKSRERKTSLQSRPASRS